MAIVEKNTVNTKMKLFFIILKIRKMILLYIMVYKQRDIEKVSRGKEEKEGMPHGIPPCKLKTTNKRNR